MSEDNHRISYMPTKGLCYDPEDPKYWDEASLNLEITRVFEVCHGCRMCFKYCESFPALFKSIDEKHDGNVRNITESETKDVMDKCFQCKLCEVQCPYTPRDSHEYLLDFPKLVHRYKAIAHRKHGSRLRDKVLADPDSAGRIARLSLGSANVMNRVGAHRFMMEKLLGIHREKLLPNFSSSTFETWAKKNKKIKSALPPSVTPPSNKENFDERPISAPPSNLPAGIPATDTTNATDAPEAVLFQTCYVQNNEPEIGVDTIEVLEKNRVNIACVEGLKCCGMPSWEHGDIQTLRKNARHNLDIILPFVKSGAKVLAINPTCGMMMRREYTELLAESDRADAALVADAVRDPGEFLWSIRKQDRFNTDFKSTPGKSIGFHAPCHLRAQAVGFKGRDLLKKIPGVTPKLVMECCGHDGTYAMKKESYEDSIKVGTKAFDGMQSADAEVWSTECPLAAIQFKQHAGIKPMHPMSILAKAYKEDGFTQKIIDDDRQK